MNSHSTAFWVTVTSNSSLYATGPDRCPVLSVCNVGLSWPNGWMDQDATWYTDVGLGPGDIVLHGDPASPRKGAQQLPNVLAHV